MLLLFSSSLKGDIGCTLNFNLPFDRLIGPASAYLQASGLSGCAYLLQLIFLTHTLTHSLTHARSFTRLLIWSRALTLLFHSLFTILSFGPLSLSFSLSLFFSLPHSLFLCALLILQLLLLLHGSCCSVIYECDSNPTDRPVELVRCT